ncbi:hypothetical protein, partial [Salmonella sp. s54925]
MKLQICLVLVLVALCAAKPRRSHKKHVEGGTNGETASEGGKPKRYFSVKIKEQGFKVDEKVEGRKVSLFFRMMQRFGFCVATRLNLLQKYIEERRPEEGERHGCEGHGGERHGGEGHGGERPSGEGRGG